MDDYELALHHLTTLQNAAERGAYNLANEIDLDRIYCGFCAVIADAMETLSAYMGGVK